jgi:hypothetical protein
MALLLLTWCWAAGALVMQLLHASSDCSSISWLVLLRSN